MKKIVNVVANYLLLLLSSVIFLGTDWAFANFNQLSIDQTLFHLMVPINGVETSYFESFFKECVFWPLIIVALIIYFIFKKHSYTITASLKIWNKTFNFKAFPYHLLKRILIIFSLVVFIFSLKHANDKFKLKEYIDNYLSESLFIEKNYVDPKETKITFPAKKKNLIYIYLESMENTYLSYELGGNNKDNLLPNLSKMALKNTSFSNNDKLGGSLSFSGTGWTIASMVSQSTGVNLKIPINGNSLDAYAKFLPGSYSIGEILKDNGYSNTIMVGSDLIFGGRELFYQQHGAYEIFDFKTAISEAKIPSDYDIGWWGFEDKKLIEFAKEKLLELSKKDEPFNLTMLTVDTHHIGGYLDETCETKYDKRYSNVIACNDKMISGFINWIMKQDFYENTTIVVTGDHLSMDTSFFADLNPNYQRTVFNMIINSEVVTENTKNRIFGVFDMYPTTLAAMGVTIEGDRLGLGTNLFSDKQTYAEMYPEFNTEISKRSNFYNNKLLYGL